MTLQTHLSYGKAVHRR